MNGNTADSTTLREFLTKIETTYGKARRVWVMDRGMVSDENIAFLQEREASYIVGTPKSLLRKFERDLLAKDWEQVHEGVDVRLCESPNGKELFVLCRSRDRRAT